MEMKMKKNRRRGLSGSDEFHVDAAKKSIDAAWLDLERMPPTCEGGIRLATRAYAAAQEAKAHLWAIDDRQAHTELFGDANRATTAAWKTVNHFAGVCRAPNREAAKRPLFSRDRRKRR